MRTVVGTPGCLTALGPERCPWPTPWGRLRLLSPGGTTDRRLRLTALACQADLKHSARRAERPHLLQPGGTPAILDSNPLQESIRAWTEFLRTSVSRKTGLFSGRQSHRGNSQDPRSLRCLRGGNESEEAT